MEDLLARIWENLGLRVTGPMKFRFILQPLMSLFFAYRAGKRDAHSESVPFFYGLIFNTGGRKDLMKQGWKDVGKVFILATVLDIVYQLILIFSKETQGAFYPFESIIVAIVLAFIPYLIFRGIFNRLFRKTGGSKEVK
jgi:hypothetical protein